MDPGSAMLIAAAISSAAQGAGTAMGASKQKKADKAASKEMRRGTYADLINEARDRQAEVEGMRYNSRYKLGKQRNQALMDTAATVREAFGI